MKIELNEFKAKKNGITTPKALINNLLNHICESPENEIEVAIYITRNKEGEVVIGYSEGKQSEIVGLLEIGKTMVVNDILEQ